MDIEITGVITDAVFDNFLSLIELHGGEFFGQYNDSSIKGDLSADNPKKGSLETILPFLELFCKRRKLVLKIKVV
jgi:hypothetical protein